MNTKNDHIYHALKAVFLTFSLVIGIHSTHSQERYSLQKTLQQAKNNNPELQQEAYGIEMAKADVITAKLRLNFELENETMQIAKPSDFSTSTHWYDRNNREVFWHLSKPFQWFGQRNNQIDVANLGLAVATENFENAARNIYFDLAEKWLEVWEAQRQLEVLEKAIQNIESLQEINQHRYDNEVITETDLARTNLLFNQYQIQLKNVQQEVISHQKELGYLMGINEAVEVDSTINVLLEVPKDLDSLISTSIEQRNDIRSVRQEMKMAESNIKWQRSLAIPQPELGVIYSPMEGVPFLGFSFAIELPVFDRNQGEIKRAMLEKEQADLLLIQMQNKVRTEVEIAYEKYQIQQQNIQDFDELLQQAENILENVKQTYLLGGTTIIDFLEAQRSWLDMQQEHYELQYEYSNSYLQLLFATGLITHLAN